MSAPTLDRHPGSSQAGSSEGRRRGRKQLILVASALIVLSLAVGTSLALATRPVARQDPAAAAPTVAAEDQNAVAGQGSAAGQGQDATGTAGGTGSGGQVSGTEAAAPVLPDGDTTAYITKVASDRIVVDVVQVFNDDKAVKAAIADGKPPAEAKYLTGWVRNENPRLRTLTLAGNVRVELLGGDCEAPLSHKLSELAAHARSGANTNYYALTVTGGAVQRIQELRTGNAC
jgi:hypothetical protein